MPSPFPGMDPWLEDPAIYPDLHNSFIIKLGDAINPQLPAPYYATSASRVWIDLSYRLIEPDVNVLYPSNSPRTANGKRKATTAVAATKPRRVHVQSVIENDETSEWFLEIYAKPDNDQLITAIELLSHSNKRPGYKGRELYQEKQDELLKNRVNLVEIDLLRGGMHTTAVPRAVLEQDFGAFDYHVSIRPMEEPDDFLIYSWPLDVRLPRITVPLLPGAPGVVVDLQEILDQCYDQRNYDRRTHYRTRKPKPPLTKKQKQWAEKILKSKGL